MNTTAFSNLAQNLTSSATTGLTGGDGILGVGLVLLALAISLMLTWATLRLTLVAMGAAPRQPTPPKQQQQQTSKAGRTDPSDQFRPLKSLFGEGILLIRAESVLLALWDTFYLFLSGLVTAARDFWTNLFENPLLLIVYVVGIGVALIFLEFHDIILPFSFEAIQCYVRPVLDQFVFPLLNVGRVLFAAFWALVNAYYDVLSALTYSNLRILLQCTTRQIIEDVLFNIGNGIKALVTSLSIFVLNLFNDGRWDLIPALTYFGLAFNATRPVAECYCTDADPLLDYVYAVPQFPSLYITIDCGVNTATRLVQILLNAIAYFQSPDLSLFTEEATCADFAAGDYAQDIVLNNIEFVTGIIELIEEELSSSVSLESRQVQFTRMVGMFATAESTLILPASVKRVFMRTGATSNRHVAMFAASAVDTAIAAAHGRAASLFVHVDDVMLVQQQEAFGFIINPNITALTQLGIDALLRLGNTNWAHIITGPVAVALGAVNLTINAICHPIASLTSADGIAYFQYGVMGDYTRLVAIAVADLLVFFSPALPCTFSKPLQVLLSTAETVVELFTAFMFSIYKPWLPGVPPPTNCSVTNCSFSPLQWDLSVLPAYYNWSGSRLRRSLDLFVEGGECTAFLLGCNTTAENNNSTNTTSNCTDAPLACTVRSINRVFVSSLNVSLALIFDLPDLLSFQSNLTTFSALPVVETQLAWEDFIFCFGQFINSFDTDMCLTNSTPPDRPTNPNFTLAPDDPIGVISIPPRTEWECRIDGGAYYWDGRQVVILNASDVLAYFASQLMCNITATRACAIAVSQSVEVIGSAPEDNVTLLISPSWVDNAGAQPLILIYNATTGTSLEAVPNATTLVDMYNITSVVETSCTHAGTLPTPLGPQYACALYNNETAYVRPYAQYAGTFYAAYGTTPLTTPTPYPCTSTTPTNLFCGLDGLAYFTLTSVGVRPVYVQVRNVNASAFDQPLACVAGVAPIRFTAPASRVVCFANTLVFFRDPFPVTVPVGVDLFWPIYIYPDISISSTTLSLACENAPPPTYVCLFDMGLYLMSVSPLTSGELIASVTPTEDYLFDCVPNPATTTPVCTRVTVTYLNGLTTVVEIEGGEVRVYANNTKEPVPCLYPSVDLPTINGSSTASAAFARDDDNMLASAEGLSFRDIFTAAHASIDAQYVARDAAMNPVIASTTDLNLLRARPDVVIQQAARSRTPDVRLLRVQRLMTFATDVHVAAVSLKMNIICCSSEVITLTLQMFVSTFYTVVHLLIGILTKIAVPAYPVNVPTFATSRDALRAALCKLACVVTEFIPFEFQCLNSGDGACNESTGCLRNYLCELFEFPVLVVDFVVTTLQLIQSLQQGQSPSNAFLGANCSIGNTAGCLTGFIVTQILSPVKATTMLFRTAATMLDCVFCAIQHVVSPTSSCIPVFYTVINTLANVVDAVASTILTLLINFILAVVQFVIYLFAGRFAAAGSVLLTYFVDFLVSLFTNLGELILQVLERIPFIGPIIRNVVNLFRGSCNVFNSLITLFGIHPLSCSSVPSRKRALFYVAATHWLGPFSEYVSRVWATDDARAACAARMAALNATDFNEVSEDVMVRDEVLYCASAHFWVGDNVSVDYTGSPNMCDSLMPTLYRDGLTWLNIPSTARAIAADCVHARIKAESVRVDASWVPHDLYYNGNQFVGLVRLGSDVMFSYSVWRQYNSDRLTSAGQLVSPSYRDALASSGYVVDHLDALAAQNLTVGAVHTIVASDSGDFSLAAYADRALVEAGHGDTALTPMSRRRAVSQLVPRAQLMTPPDRDRIVGIVQSLWEPLLNASRVNDTDASAPTIIGSVMEIVMNRFDARNDYTTTSLPITDGLLTRMFAADDPTLLHRTTKGGFSALADIPAVMVRVLRSLSAPTPNVSVVTRKRVVLAATPVVNDTTLRHVPLYFFNTMRGAFTLFGQLMSGTTSRIFSWTRNTTALNYLATEAVRDPIVEGVWSRRPSIVHEGLSTVFAGMLQLITPTRPGSGGAEMSAMFARAMSDRTSGSASVSAARTRRARISRFVSRTALSVAGHAPLTLRDRARISEVNNATGDTCLFAVYGNSSNSSEPNITYPLCQACLGADMILGRIQRASFQLQTYFGFNTPNCSECATDQYPSLNYSYAQYAFFYDYITDVNAVVIVGDSAELPARWPWRHYDNLRWFADPTPNKTGFAPLVTLLNDTLNYLRNVITHVSTASAAAAASSAHPAVVNSDGSVHIAVAPKPRPILDRFYERVGSQAVLSDSPIHAPFRQAGQILAEQLVAWARNGTSPLGGSGGSVSTSATPTPETFGEIAQEWLDAALGVILCPWPSLSVNAKRFSVAESVLIYMVVFIAIVLFFQALQFGWVFTLAASTFITLTVVFVTFTAVTYDYGVLCFPALPLAYADDGLYALAFSFLSKCGIGYGVVNEDYYDNTNCYPCANWQNGMFTVPNFYQSFAKGGRFGFSDFRYNLAFIIHEAAPTLYAALRPGGSLYDTRIVSVLVRSAFVQDPLAAYANVDASTPDTFWSQAWQGSTWVTGIANLFLIMAISYLVLRLFGPFIVQTLAFLAAVFLLVLPLLLFTFNGFYTVASLTNLDDNDPTLQASVWELLNAPDEIPPHQKKKRARAKSVTSRGGGDYERV